MRFAFRIVSGLVLLGFYRVTLKCGALLADELGTIIGESYNFYIVPFCSAAALVAFGYVAAWWFRLEVPIAAIPIRRRNANSRRSTKRRR